MLEKFVDYAEKIMNYAEILTVNKIKKKAFPTYRTMVKLVKKVLQSLTHNLPVRLIVNAHHFRQLWKYAWSLYGIFADLHSFSIAY